MRDFFVVSLFLRVQYIVLLLQKEQCTPSILTSSGWILREQSLSQRITLTSILLQHLKHFAVEFLAVVVLVFHIGTLGIDDTKRSAKFPDRIADVEPG